MITIFWYIAYFIMIAGMAFVRPGALVLIVFLACACHTSLIPIVTQECRTGDGLTSCTYSLRD